MLQFVSLQIMNLSPSKELVKNLDRTFPGHGCMISLIHKRHLQTMNSMMAKKSRLFTKQVYVIDIVQGPQGCQKVHKNMLQITLLSSCANIAPKRHKLWKIVKIEKKCQKKPVFLEYFQIFFNLGAIFAHQTSNGMFSGPRRIFWHPWDPWGRIHIEEIKVLVFVFKFFWVVAPPITFFK